MIRPEKFREYISHLWRWQRLTKKPKRLRLSVPQDLSFFGVFSFSFFILFLCTAFTVHYIPYSVSSKIYAWNKSPVVFHWIYSPSVLGTKPRWDGTPELGIL